LRHNPSHDLVVLRYVASDDRYLDDAARLSIATTIALPDEFEITIPQKSIACYARLIWRKGDQAGIDFSAAKPEREHPARVDPDVETGELRLEVARLNAENQRLRAQIDRLRQGY
jgi:hypothetical protein